MRRWYNFTPPLLALDHSNSPIAVSSSVAARITTTTTTTTIVIARNHSLLYPILNNDRVLPTSSASSI